MKQLITLEGDAEGSWLTSPTVATAPWDHDMALWGPSTQHPGMPETLQRGREWPM